MDIHARVNSMHSTQNLPDVYLGYAIIYPVVLLIGEDSLEIDFMRGVLRTSIQDDDHLLPASLHFNQAFQVAFTRDWGPMDCLEGGDLCQSLCRHTLTEVVVASHEDFL